MSGIRILLQFGAYVCLLLGAYCTVCLVVMLSTRRIETGSNALGLLLFIIYTLLAFVPFIAFVYPTSKTTRKPVFVSAALIEVLVLGLFLCQILFPTI